MLKRTKLCLNRETIKHLETHDLKGVAGGVPVPTVLNTHCQSCRGPVCDNQTWDCSANC